MATHRLVITLSCPDRTGIVATITGRLAALGASITEAAYHADTAAGWFVTRQVVDAASVPGGADVLRVVMGQVAAGLEVPGGDPVRWQVRDAAEPPRVVLLVSKESHCLHDLLGRVWGGELEMDVRAVVGNHEVLRPLAEAHGVPFHHVPFPSRAEDDEARSGRDAAFAEVAALVDEHDPAAIVLARFMQVLTPELCDRWAGRAINIHHSFLPSFAGARPYHQAHARGVKLVGATCHYVTADLDAGPIIEQDVSRVDHADTAEDMVRRGRDVEKLVLARGLRAHLEDRVQVHAGRTVVFR
ncbi:formyltetrahydrofolate deformylase [Actinomycetospora sp. NBC_00405]|jgi:formyltetrahydrofolate deformylase|uniref:formyltetrahydrofolate deformylase n=1 Tax=Actinomycetospora sp. NBC_00405 TaxID=2975952 RepID=UPI002E20F887